MKNKLVILLVLALFIITGCGASFYKMNGKTLNFSETFKNRYITYKYPSEFKEVEQENSSTHVYEFYDDDDKLSFVLKVEEHALILSFGPMEEDAQKLETNPEHKNVSHKTIKNNGKNLVRYSFNKDDEFGTDTLYYVYYGGYSYAGVNEYIKITFINVGGNEGFEKTFLSSFKINK